MSKATADWERVGDKFYRKTQIYTSVFDPDLELENYVVTGAPYSGAVGTHVHTLREDCANAIQHYTEAKTRSTPIVARKQRNPLSTSTVAPGS